MRIIKMNKIVDKETLKMLCGALHDAGKKIVLCHGVFDLLHPGHIKHFQEAKSLGDVLIVSVTAAKYVRKGPGRPYFNDLRRMESLAALTCIDYVTISESYTVEDTVSIVRPNIYVKGQEYEDPTNDVTGNIDKEVTLVKQYGGRVHYTHGEVFSSTKLLNTAFPVFSDELKKYLTKFQKTYSINEIFEYIKYFEKLKILIIGDIILDDYIYCKIQGLMSKNNGYSAKYLKHERYLGGSIAIANHVGGFCNDVTLMSLVGKNADINKYIHDKCDSNLSLILTESNEYETIIKKRYVEPDDRRHELNKVFVVNNLPTNMVVSPKALLPFKAGLRKNIKCYDAIFLCDFGHGLIDDEVVDIVQSQSKKLILNCQTNSSNYGLNPITKYKRADYYTLDEKELRIAFGDYRRDVKTLLLRLSEHLHSNGCLTCGSKGAIMIDDGKTNECPAFTLDVIDTIGAGDAFFALSGLAVVSNAPMNLTTFFGNVAGALAANIVGNSKPISKSDVMKFIETLMKG